MRGTEAWEKIKKAFEGTKCGSRVIITRRNKKIAQMVNDILFSRSHIRAFIYGL